MFVEDNILLILNKSSGSIPTLKLNSNIGERMINKKPNYLTTILPRKLWSKTQIKKLPHIDPSNHTLDSIVISRQDVKDILLHSIVTKASGPDLVKIRLLKEGADIYALPFSIIFNRSLDQGYFPQNFERTNVTSIYKNDKPMPSNYRPTSLLSQSAKEMERCVHIYLYNYSN